MDHLISTYPFFAELPRPSAWFWRLRPSSTDGFSAARGFYSAGRFCYGSDCGSGLKPQESTWSSVGIRWELSRDPFYRVERVKN